MESGARDLSIGVKYMYSRAHSAFISTAHFFPAAILLYVGQQNVGEKSASSLRTGRAAQFFLDVC